MVWSCFTASGFGSLVLIKGIMSQDSYKQIIIHHAKPALYSFDSAYFQLDNDPTIKRNSDWMYTFWGR